MSQTGMKKKNLNPFELLPIEISLYNYGNLLVLRASLFECGRTEECYFNIISKFVGKINTKASQTVLKS